MRETYRINAICESISETHKLQQENIILINTSDVYDGIVLNHTFVPNNDLRGQFKKSFQRNDILYSEIRPKNKRYAFVNFDALDYVASTKLMVLRCKKDYVLPEYLFQILKSETMLNQLQLLAETRSGTFPQITFTELGSLEIALSPLPEQRAIAATLSCLDAKIELNKKINANLEAQAQAIFKSWFVDFEPFRDGEFMDSELGPIPKGWRVGTLSDFCVMIARGITPKYTEENGQIILNQKCIREHKVNLASARNHVPKAINEKWLQWGDILVNSTGQGTLGRAAQWFWDQKNITVDSHVSIVRPVNKELIYFLGQLVISRENEIESMASGSTGQTELSRERLSSMNIILPDNSALKKYASIISPIMDTVLKKINETTCLAKLHDILLPKLMSSEIAVPVEVE